jgi:oligopeptide/dipeptide ABC transporter ATP-binding protein
MKNEQALLEIEDLKISFRAPDGYIEAVRGVSLSLTAGEIMSLVGESGSGKSITMRAIMGLLPASARVTGSARFQGVELIGRPERELRRIRGGQMSMVFQDPMTALNPVIRVGTQIVEAIRLHNPALSLKASRARAIELLRDVAIPFPEQRMEQYPHEFSGGMRQRVVIAMAIANRPKLIIADEPTTALDVTVQAQILELMKALCRDHGLGLILITHDLGVVAGMAERVSVMYAGSVVECGTAAEIFYTPAHPYTRGLLGSLPAISGPIGRLTDIGGAPPTILNMPPGCAFHPRCSFARERCSFERPTLRPVRQELSACHFAEELPSYTPEKAFA